MTFAIGGKLRGMSERQHGGPLSGSPSGRAHTDRFWQWSCYFPLVINKEPAVSRAQRLLDLIQLHALSAIRRYHPAAPEIVAPGLGFGLVLPTDDHHLTPLGTDGYR